MSQGGASPLFFAGTLVRGTEGHLISSNNSCSNYEPKEVHILTNEIRAARRSKGLTQQDVAELCGVNRQVIKRLEAGVGSSTTLHAVMNVIDFHVIGIGAGRTLGEQLRNRRMKRDWSVQKVATKASLSRATITALEANRGTIASLQRLLEVVAPNAKRRAPERAYWGQGQKEQRDVRFTPPDFLASLVSIFGPIDMDPCGHRDSPLIASRRFLLEEGDDGLGDDWSGRFAFVNPPFSDVLKWTKRAHREWAEGHVGRVALLSPVRTDSKWFHEVLVKDAAIYLLEGRLRFLLPEGGAQNTPYSLMLVLLGSDQAERKHLADVLPGCWMIGRSR